MCGIAGVWSTQRVEHLEAAVARMVAVQRHRGPDEERVVAVSTGGVPLVLGFDRLAILDLTPAASQPMCHDATGSWLVFNGEIYNFRELRATLEAAGHRFRSRGDTEVLLAALVEWGEAALERLRGMYAFAFWDGRRRRLLLGRDPFGIKPLLYARMGGAFVFASELRALRAARLGSFEVDRAALAAYLAYGAVPEPHTIVREARALPPGYVLAVEAGGTTERLRRVLGIEDALPAPDAPAAVTLDRGVCEVEATLAASVKAHLVSDVPLGVLLSGGVDSTLVASLVSAERNGAEPSFLTVDFDEPGFSEIGTARATALRLGGRHHVVGLRADDVLALLPEALAAMDQPTADGVNTFVITRAAATHGIKVLVSGLGGDELFGGYTSFHKAPLLARNASWLAPLGRPLAALGWGNAAQWSKVAAAGGLGELREAYVLQRALGSDAVDEDARYGLSPAMWDALAAPGARSDFHRVSYLELSFYLRNQLLRDADIFSSANSVELRVPFLDLDVLRVAWRLPPSCHVSSFGGRKLVLKALLRRLQPERRLRRAKMGFVFPWVEWLRGALGEHVVATLTDRTAHDALGLDPAVGERLLAAFRRRDPRVGWAQLWSRFVLLEWHRRVLA